MPKERVTVLRTLMTVAALMLGTSVSCGSDSGNGSSPKQEAEVPGGWERFDNGAISGAAPSDWNHYILESDEFLSLAKEVVHSSAAGGLAVAPVPDLTVTDPAST